MNCSKEGETKYSRVLLKLSGNLFGDADNRGISLDAFLKIAESIAKIKKENDIQLAIVLGGGNIFRGREFQKEEFDSVTADTMGMLGTIMNGLALQEVLEKMGIPSRMMTAIYMRSVAEFYIKKRAAHHLETGRVVIFTGGIGNPFFTTDSAAALRACELDCDLILKATDVDGVYDKDPKKYKNEAKFFEKITYKEVIEKNLKVMDVAAFALARKKNIPIIVFNEKYLNRIFEVLKGGKIGTLVN